MALCTLIFIAFQLSCTGVNAESKQLYEMTNHEIDSLLTKVSHGKLTISDRISFYSEKFLGTVYNFNCVGDGPYALIESLPLVNFQETNCMAFCEHVLALSISDSWEIFFNNLQQIRYKDGIIGMRTRNHYTMADWLPENSWILEDISRKIGGDYTKSATRIISHRKFFANKGIKDMRYVLPDREITIEYVPLKYIAESEKNIKPGDILALIYANKTNIFSAHMLIVAEKNGKLFIRESSKSRTTTFETPYKEWVKKVEDSKIYAGLSFMRVREDIDEPGRIILPWEIGKLKTDREY